MDEASALGIPFHTYVYAGQVELRGSHGTPSFIVRWLSGLLKNQTLGSGRTFLLLTTVQYPTCVTTCPSKPNSTALLVRPISTGS
jgi:hypothetical protein